MIDADINKIEKGLNKIREKEQIIPTFSSEYLKKEPETVNSLYSINASTHMPLGVTSEYLDNLIRCTIENKTCVVGAIVGKYGHGKTSTSVYLWKECEKKEIVCVPPFEWHSLTDLIDGIYGWLRYKLNIVLAEHLITELESLYSEYINNSLEKISISEDADIDTLKKLKEKGFLNIQISPENVIDFIAQATEIAKKAKFKGLLVFTDELQETLEKYPTERIFYTDLFSIVNGLIHKQGNYGLIICMPTNTETRIIGVRKDIIDRLKFSNLYIRTDEIYDINFPKILWDKYSELYDFKNKKYDIVEPETLESIGQISCRDDLGGGPRNVIDSFIQISIFYTKNKKKYTPLDLVNDYLERKISFNTNSKFVEIIKDELSSSIINQNVKTSNLIKLLAAFPKGCNNDIIIKYELLQELNEIKSKIYGTVIQKLPDGYTLCKLLENEVKESFYIDLVKDFIHMYNNDKDHLQMAINGFAKHIFENEKFFKVRRKDQIDGWNKEPAIVDKNKIYFKFNGTFDLNYPQRDFAIDISDKKANFEGDETEFIFWFQLRKDLDNKMPSTLKKHDKNKLIFTLNLMKEYNKKLQVPFEEIFPDGKITPLFMLSLLDYIDQNKDIIPAYEMTEGVNRLIERLEECSIELLFNEDIKKNSDIKLKLAGLQVLKDSFITLCKECYPEYNTLITSGRWDTILEDRYIKSLKDEKLSLKIIRGREPFISNKESIGEIFGIKSAESLQVVLSSLSNIIKFEWGGKTNDSAKLTYLMHPLENYTLEQLRASDITKNNNLKVHILKRNSLYNKAMIYGYKKEEVDAILKLLYHRKYIIVNNETDSIEEKIESPEEYQRGLNDQALEIKEIIRTLSIVPEFDANSFIKRLDDSIKQIPSVNQYEEFEDNRLELFKIVTELRLIKNQKVLSIKSIVDSHNSRLSSIIDNGVPQKIKEDKKANFSWISEFNKIRILIYKEYTEFINSLRYELQLIKDILRKLNKDINNEDFIEIFNGYTKVEIEISVLINNYNNLKNIIDNYSQWDEILPLAGDTISGAIILKQNYKNSTYIDKVEEEFKNITFELKTRKIEALKDYEIFKSRLESYKKDIDDWNRSKREEFNTSKKYYEQSLNKIGIETSTLRSAFDTDDPIGTFQKMFEEISEKIGIHIQSLNIRTIRIENRIEYAIKINSEELNDELEIIRDTKKSLLSINDKAISTKNIKNNEIWDKIISEIQSTNQICIELESKLRGLTQKRQLLDKEKTTLSYIDNEQEIELENIINKIIEKDGNKFELVDLMDNLRSLFKKNYIIIKVSRRR